MDLHGSGGPRHLNALPGQFVQWTAILFQGRIHRRHLLDRAKKLHQHRLQQRSIQHRNGKLCQGLPFPVGRGGGASQLDACGVALVGIQQKMGKLGGLTQTHRQQPGGQWVQRPGVTGLFGPEQPADLLQGGI